jgi:hypothetical protein
MDMENIIEGIYIDPEFELIRDCNEEFLKSQPVKYLIEINYAQSTLLEKHVELFKDAVVANLKPNETEPFVIKLPQTEKYKYAPACSELVQFVLGKVWTIYFPSDLIDLFVVSELLLKDTESVNYFKKKLRKQVLKKSEEIGWQRIYQAAKILEDKELFTWCVDNKAQGPKKIEINSSLQIYNDMSNDGLLPEAEVLDIMTTNEETSELYHDKVIALLSKFKGVKELTWFINLTEDKQVLTKIGIVLASQPDLTKLALKWKGPFDQQNLSEDFKPFAKALGELTSLTYLYLQIPNGFFVNEEMAILFADAISKLQKVEEAHLVHEQSDARAKVFARALEGFSALPLLQTFELKIDCFGFTKVDTDEDNFEIAYSLAKLIHLKDAKLIFNSWTLKGQALAKILEAITKWTELEKLYLNGAYSIIAADSGMTLLAEALPKLSKLTYFFLDNEAYSEGLLTNKGLAAIAEGLPKSLVDVTLKVSGNEQITDEGFISLLTGLSKLTNTKKFTIDLERSNLTDNGFSKFSLLSTLKDVDRMSFNFSKLGNDVTNRDDEWIELLNSTTPCVQITHPSW